MERISNYVGALCRTLVNVKKNKKKQKKKNRQLASRKQLEIWRKTDHFSYVALSKQRNQAVFFFYLQSQDKSHHQESIIIRVVSVFVYECPQKGELKSVHK